MCEKGGLLWSRRNWEIYICKQISGSDIYRYGGQHKRNGCVEV